MTAAPSTADHVAVAPRWGLGDALAGWVFAYVAAGVVGAIVLAAFGYGDATPDELPLSMIALQYPPLWLGFVGVPIWAAATKGGGWIHDFRVRLRPLDVPLGLVVGVVAQLAVVPLVSWPVLRLTGTDAEDLGRLARDLGDKADSTVGVVLLFVIVAIGAPIAEELFFRGLVLRSFENRFGTAWAVVGSSAFFGATHFQPLQFAALTAAGAIFALLVVRTGRLGPAIVAHMAFNAVTVVSVVRVGS
ncbi:MAG: CPBP family intramembrane glutamic endopeptidase [Acidimicrobiales bacterium]|nr:CPBP family intramembrane metalloprotease [Actinomycetota bacterium]